MRSTRITSREPTPGAGGDLECGERTRDLGEGPRVLLAEGPDLHLSPSISAIADAGFVVDCSFDREGALAMVDAHRYGAIVADVALANLNVLDLLRAARRHDLDVPLVVVTGEAGLGLATVAVQQGALSYLEKPVSAQQLRETLAYGCKLYELAKLRRRALDTLGGQWSQMGDRVSLELAFERAFGCLSIAFQPILSWSNRRVIGHEALLRSSDPQLPGPASVLAVAERLGRIDQIGRLVRERVARSMSKAPAEFVFVNLHPHEMLDSDLYSSAAPLSQFAKRVVLEISEHALLDEVEHLEARAQALRRLGFRLAMDNLGPGYPGLSSFARLRPDFVKYDLSLVRGVDRNPVQAEVVGAMTALFASMGTRVIASGIESIPERDAIIAAGVDLLQGFAFSMPDTNYRQPDVG